MKLPSVCNRGRLSSVVLFLNLVLCANCFVTPLRNTTDTEVIGAEPGPRNSRFLFDTLFGIEETSYNSDDDEPAVAQNTLKSCDCGEWKLFSSVTKRYSKHQSISKDHFFVYTVASAISLLSPGLVIYLVNGIARIRGHVIHEIKTGGGMDSGISCNK